MGFVQSIEFRTTQLDKVRLAGDEWEKSTLGKNKVRHRVLVEDREDPGRYFNIVFFDSYDDAMENSAMPETDALAQKMKDLCDGPAIFHNLNVLEER